MYRPAFAGGLSQHPFTDGGRSRFLFSVMDYLHRDWLGVVGHFPANFYNFQDCRASASGSVDLSLPDGLFHDDRVADFFQKLKFYG